MSANPTVGLFFVLGVMFLAARLAGTVARKLGQPRVLGELIIGVVLGPTLIDLLHTPAVHGAELNAILKSLADIGVVMLMFLVGVEINPVELLRVGRVGLIAGLLGAITPVLLAAPLVLLFNYNLLTAVFVGVTLAATSVSISAQVLLELGVLRTQAGNALLATALVDDVIAIVLVSLTIAFAGTAESAADLGTMVGIVVRMALYMGVAFGVAWFVLPPLFRWAERRPILAQSYGLPALALVTALLFSWSAEAWGGVATITGAFIAGAGLSRLKHHAKHQIVEAFSHMAYVFFVPIFFLDVGLETNLRNFPLSALPLALLLLVVAVVSKVGGCGLGARLGGFTRQESFRVGVCMIARGEVGLIIASLGVGVGIFQEADPLFASVFLVILLTTLLTPILVRRVFPQRTVAGAIIPPAE